MCVDEWRNTPPGVLLPIGVAFGIAFVVVAFDSDLQPVVRALFLLAALAIVTAIALWARRTLRSRGNRIRREHLD
ncbi:MAG: hypothetical protein QOH03_1660 [Kribbellaceae bacterium]|nr:hypothetical protein [Kribbellaceae bacterium]